MQSYITEAIIVMAIVSGIPLIVSTIFGTLLAIIQSALQLQEQSLGYLVKLVGLGATIFFCANWFSARLLTFSADALRSIATLGRIM